ncbi:SET domain-containing protein-lysine N-methyltransferase [Patescibacteria group bacterium]|jgi:hypothetical protein|nr:SET domain-containing protein-lysine N-methyltransferase [Patescibacteria group bacterium]
MDTTNEFSFMLKPSTIPEAGVGVFTLHNIKSGTQLRVWGDQVQDDANRARVLRPADVPKGLQGYCVADGDTLLCPDDFGQMHVGWYLNHSNEPNVRIDMRKWFFALRDIAAGEELFLDYRTLNEPASSKEEYYTS